MVREAEVKRKLKSLSEWEEMVEKAGLANITSKRIDRLLELSSLSTGRENELSKVVKGIRKRTKARS